MVLTTVRLFMRGSEQSLFSVQRSYHWQGSVLSFFSPPDDPLIHTHTTFLTISLRQAPKPGITVATKQAAAVPHACRGIDRHPKDIWCGSGDWLLR